MAIIDNHNLKSLVDRYQAAKANGSLDNSSEATMRTWIDELLSVFGWNVQDTHQVLTVPLAFVDATGLDVNNETSHFLPICN